MLHKCANPACPNPFRQLSQGKLFQVETGDFTASIPRPLTPKRRLRSLRHVEHYWLCDECCSLLTLTFEKARGMITVPLHTGNKNVTPFAFGERTGTDRTSASSRGSSRRTMKGAIWTG